MIKSFQGMANLRQIIGEYLIDLGHSDKRVVVVNADSREGGRNKAFAETFPEREFNVGIAEQNMIGCAAGLAHEGFIPFAFSFSPFITMRACEQVRTDVAYSRANVRMIGSYGGYSGGISGVTHWGLEDVAIMSAIDGMTVLEASDPYQVLKMMDASLDYDGPIYLRVGVMPVKVLYNEDYEFEIGKATLVRDGNDGSFLVSGPLVQYALEAAKQIESEIGAQVSVIDMHSLKPLDKDSVLRAASTGCVIAAEDHNKIGGLGYMAGAAIAEAGIACKFKILGCADDFIPMAHAPYLYHKYEYDCEGLKKHMLAMLSDF